jgi:predicted RNA-binding protein with PIN domain
VPYLVDGNNLIGAERGGRASREDQAALVREVSDRLRSTRARVVLFFDGAGDPLSLGSLSVRFAGATTADDAIFREVERSNRPQEVTVVTADRELSRRARDAGGSTTTPSEFWKRFGAQARPSPRSGGEARVDVDDWLEWFSDDRNRKE